MTKSIINHQSLMVQIFLKIFLLLLLQTPFFLIAQTFPTFLPEDFDSDVEDVGCICSPGVINKSPGKGLLIEYTTITGGDFTPDEVAIGISPSKVSGLGRLRLRLKVPIIIKPKIKLLIGFDHFREKYNFNFVEPIFSNKLDLINGKILKSTRMSLYLLQSINETNYLGLRARVSFNGNYGGMLNMDAFYRQIKFSAIWGIKKREDQEWGIGLLYSEGFGKKVVLPFFLYNHTFNERWGIEAGFPISVLMRYNFNPRNLLLFGPELSSAKYALKGDDPNAVANDFFFKHTEIQFGAKYEKQLLPWIWGNVHTGLQINFDSEYKNAILDRGSFQPDLKTGIFFRIGLFMSPVQ